MVQQSRTSPARHKRGSVLCVLCAHVRSRVVRVHRCTKGEKRCAFPIKAKDTRGETLSIIAHTLLSHILRRRGGNKLVEGEERGGEGRGGRDACFEAGETRRRRRRQL